MPDEKEKGSPARPPELTRREAIAKAATFSAAVLALVAGAARVGDPNEAAPASSGSPPKAPHHAYADYRAYRDYHDYRDYRDTRGYSDYKYAVYREYRTKY